LGRLEEDQIDGLKNSNFSLEITMDPAGKIGNIWDNHQV
jgi:hypothetical protein